MLVQVDPSKRLFPTPTLKDIESIGNPLQTFRAGHWGPESPSLAQIVLARA